MQVQTSQYQQGTRISTPIFVEADGVVDKLKIRSLTGDDALCKKVVAFLENNVFEFYKNGQGYTHQEAVNTVKLLRDRFENGIPFSGLAVLDGEQVVGFIRIGFDSDPRKLQIAGMCLKDYENKGYGQQALQWVMTQYLPALHKKGYRLSVLNPDGKTVREWVDLDKTSIVATVHPDHLHGNHLLTKCGFKLVKKIRINEFSGAHDSRRNVHEIALGRFMPK